MAEFLLGSSSKYDNKAKLKKSQSSTNKAKETQKKEVNKETTQVSVPEEVKKDYRFPLDFIEYLEKKHIPKKFIPEIENIFQIGNCQSNGPKYDVLNFQKKNQINELNSQGITAITGQGDNLFVGIAQGIVKKLSCKEEKELCTFNDQYIDSLQICKIVMCIDVSNDGNFMAVGYSNGFISLWNLKNNKLIKLIEKVHRSSILTLKFTATSVKIQELLSSDKEGNVVLLTFKQKLLITTFQTVLFLKDKSPVFVIDIFNPTIEQRKAYPFCDHDVVLGAFGSLKKVVLIAIKPGPKKMLKIENPVYNNSREIPDISFGIGNEPMRNRSQFAIKSQDKQDLSVLVAISWNTVISIYKISMEHCTISTEAIGYYKNDNYQILRMGFLDTSEIYFLDSLKKIKILHTSFMNTQLIVNDKKGRKTNDSSCLIDEGKTIDADTLCQKIVSDILDPKASSKETYNNFLFAKNKTIYFQCKKSFYFGVLLTWEESIKTLKDKNMWEDALFLAVNIYEGLITTLPGIPNDEQVRKQELTKIIHEMILYYVKYVMYKIRGEKTWNENITKCINMCIEICIQINTIDFLFKIVQPEFNKFQDTFIHLLEPFILLSRFHRFDINKETIDNLIGFYSEKTQNILLIQILFNLKFESIDITSVNNHATKHNLFTLLIYIDSQKHNYLNSIDKMYEKLPRLKDIKNKDFISYAYCLKQMPINELLTSRQYMTHKVLWFCNYCLSQKTFPDDSLIEKKNYDEIVIQILYKFLTNEVFNEFLNYDSYSFLQILSRFFVENKLISILESCDKSLFVDQIKIISRLDIEAETFVDKLMEFVIYMSQGTDSFLIQQDINQFIAVCSIKKKLNKPRAIKAGYCLLSFTNDIKKKQLSDEVFDKFNTHGLLADNPLYIKELTDILLVIIEFLDEKEISDFLMMSEVSPLIQVRIRLFMKQSRYLDAFDDIIKHKDDHMLGKKKVYEWIHLNLKELKKDNEETFNKLLNSVLDKLEILARYSFDDVMVIVNVWFQNEQQRVIHKLDHNKNMQLELIEKVLKNKNEDSIVKEGDDKIREYTDLLLLHMKLLIELNKRDQVLINLKKRNSYPLDEVLNICIENKVNDAVIDIYMSTGNNKEAMQIGIDDLVKAFNELKEYAIARTTYAEKDEKWNSLLHSFSNEKKNCINICCQSSETTTAAENEELWFLLFNELYSFQNQVNCDQPNEYIDNLKLELSSDLDLLLKDMCNYLNIKTIIDNLTINYKDAEFKQFKVFLNSMLSTFSHLMSMFHSTKNLLSNTIMYSLKQYKKENSKGIELNLKKCDYCHLNFTSGEEMIAFRCGHKVHHAPYCISKENNSPVCKMCRKNEIEGIIVKKGNSYYPQNFKPKKEENAYIAESNNKKKEDKLLKKLKEIDNYLNETNVMINKRV